MCYDNDGPLIEYADVEDRLPWLKEKHIEEIIEFLQSHATEEKDVMQVLNCKCKSDEPISEYAAQFQKCWKEKAKLSLSDTEDPFIISMF